MRSHGSLVLSLRTSQGFFPHVGKVGFGVETGNKAKHMVFCKHVHVQHLPFTWRCTCTCVLDCSINRDSSCFEVLSGIETTCTCNPGSAVY